MESLWEENPETIKHVLEKFANRISADAHAHPEKADHLYDYLFNRPVYQPPARGCYVCNQQDWIPNPLDCTTWVCGTCFEKSKKP